MSKFVFKSQTRRSEGVVVGNFQQTKKGKGPQKKSKRPAPYIIHDDYYKRAKAEGYRARSVYKLKEIQEEFSLIQPEMHVCDVGAAPGSFMQYTKKIIGNEGILVGIDIKKIDPYSQPNIHTIEHSIFDQKTLLPKIQKILQKSHPVLDTGSGKSKNTNDDSELTEFSGHASSEGQKFDLILSDIGPNTTGRNEIDQYASVELNIEIVKFSDMFLKSGGNLLLKVFKGEDFGDLLNQINKRFESFTEYKPKACRERSFEEYVICWNRL